MIPKIIYLNGSVELAPLVGLSDVIVDITESGETIRKNNLKIGQGIKGFQILNNGARMENQVVYDIKYKGDTIIK